MISHCSFGLHFSNNERWQEYTEELYKKHLQDPGNHDSVITHPEQGILECESQVGLRKHYCEQS